MPNDRADSPIAPDALKEAPARPRVRDAEVTRARLLESAEALFARKGYDGTRLREVAEDARVTVPLLCHHFHDKDGLYDAVVARGLGRVADVGWDVLRRSSSVAEQIAGLVTALADFAAREAALTSILHREMADGGVRARPLAERFLTPLKDAAVNTLRAAQQRGEVRPVDPDLLVLHIAGAVIYPSLAAPLVQAVWGGDPQDPAFVERRKRALLDLLLPLVLVPPAG